MRKYLLASAALLVVATPAAARDGSGYVGIEGGLSWIKDQDADVFVDYTVLGQTPGPPNLPLAPPPPNGQPVSLQPRSNDATPAGMKQIPSQAGKVYRTTLNGQGPIPQQSRDFYMKLMPYFDAQPQVMGYMDEPSGRMAQVGFQSTKNGQPVMGMLMVTQAPNGGAVAVVMLDSPQTFQQSMQTMMAAAQQP